jgi:hypothetical protein
MSNSTDPQKTSRVQRGDKPKGKLTRSNYRKRALAALMRDFGKRCAYSMKHSQMSGGDSAMEVDHFNPRFKKDYHQSYDNLFLATRHCNGKKSGFWPDAESEAKGVRFLNCCKEEDYGVHIFEDPDTHEVFGVTPAGIYHVRILDLNAEDLVNERRQRAEFQEALAETRAFVHGPLDEFARVMALLRDEMALMIPQIPYRKKQAMAA